MARATATAPPLTERLAAGGEATWFDPLRLLPQRGQEVRVITSRGSDYRVRFAVAFTAQWPEGASWALMGVRAALPFHDIVLWSPDPSASVPRTDDPSAPARRPRPAISYEVETQIFRTADLLRLVPTRQLDWAPHPDLPTLRTLACRLARVVARMGWILELDEVELSFEPDLPDFETTDEIRAVFEANATDVRTHLRAIDGPSLAAPWTLTRNGQAVAKTPRGNALRTFGITPLVSHHAELAQLLTTLGAQPPLTCPAWPLGHPVRTPAAWTTAQP